MATVRVVHDIDDLANDLAGIAKRVKPDMRGVVKDGLRVGVMLARANAERTSGRYSKHYRKAITLEMTGDLEGEYGPDVSMKQGNMRFEFGEGRQSAPHLNLARSADVVGPAFERSVRDQIDGWFW